VMPEPTNRRDAWRNKGDVMLDQSSQQLDVLNELMAITSAANDVPDILTRSLDVLVARFSESLGLVYLAHESHIRLVDSRGLSPGSEMQELGLNSVLWGSCAHSSRIMTLDGSQPDCPVATALFHEGCRALLLIPLRSGGVVSGCLLIGSASLAETQTVSPDFLNTVGQAIGLAVDNSRLYQQMDRRLRESQTLYDISRALATTLDLDSLLDLVVRSALDGIPKANNCVLHLLDEPTGELRPRALSFVGVLPDRSGQHGLRRGQGVAGIALETGHLANVGDVSKDDRFKRVGRARHYASLLVAPLRIGDRPIGTLSIDSDRVNAFAEEDERLSLTLATQAAAAIENARLVHDLQQSLKELKETQAQLIQSAKLSAIGQLIAGVAHELNNPLTAVMGYTQLLQTTDGMDVAVQRDLTKIYVQAQRAAKIVQNLLTFARAHKAERQFVDVNEVLQQTLELRTYQLRVESVGLDTRLAPQVLGVMADPHQLQQVFLNLINNAQDAITEHKGSGTLIVSSSIVGECIQIQVSDDGPGLSPEAQAHIFEPFFTTKEVGKGTGLGLSICFGIVSQYNGRIWAENNESGGAAFVVELPRASSVEMPEAPRQQQEPEPANEGRLILVVEDERDVALVVRRILAQDGHRVLLAEDGEAALRYLDEADARDRSFDLSIGDIKMPGLSGISLYGRIAKRSPKLLERVLFVTGDTMSPKTVEFLETVEAPYIPKPFTIAQLHAAVRPILQQSRHAVKTADPAP